MSKRYLIVNADDGNYTPAVTRGILKAHREGIVTSTSLFANFNLTGELAEQLRAAVGLGVGIHLNVTRGMPVLPAHKLHHLVTGGSFGPRARGTYEQKTFLEELFAEWQAQIDLFAGWWGNLPTHLDTHHHVHAIPRVLEVLIRLALAYHRPIRLSPALGEKERAALGAEDVPLTDALIEDLDLSNPLSEKNLKNILETLPEGVSELMCHPGEVDEALRAMSRVSDAREIELKALTQPGLKQWLSAQQIQLINYNDLSTDVRPQRRPSL